MAQLRESCGEITSTSDVDKLLQEKKLNTQQCNFNCGCIIQLYYISSFKFYTTKSVHFISLWPDATTASINAMPLTPSSALG